MKQCVSNFSCHITCINTCHFTCGVTSVAYVHKHVYSHVTSSLQHMNVTCQCNMSSLIHQVDSTAASQDNTPSRSKLGTGPSTHGNNRQGGHDAPVLMFVVVSWRTENQAMCDVVPAPAIHVFHSQDLFTPGKIPSLSCTPMPPTHHHREASPCHFSARGTQQRSISARPSTRDRGVCLDQCFAAAWTIARDFWRVKAGARLTVVAFVFCAGALFKFSCFFSNDGPISHLPNTNLISQHRISQHTREVRLVKHFSVFLFTLVKYFVPC